MRREAPASPHPQLAWVESQVPQTNYSVRSCTTISCSNSSLKGRGGASNQSLGLKPGAQQPFVLDHRSHLVLDTRPHPHQPAAAQQELPQIVVLHWRLPDCREPILHQQRQNMPGIALVRLLPARRAGPDRARIPQQKLQTRFLDQTPEPTKVPHRFRANPHRPPSQRPIKLLRLLRMVQTTLAVFARLLVDKGDLLKPRMKITSYNHHARLLSSRARGRLEATSLLGVGGSRRCREIGLQSGVPGERFVLAGVGERRYSNAQFTDKL